MYRTIKIECVYVIFRLIFAHWFSGLKMTIILLVSNLCTICIHPCICILLASLGDINLSGDDPLPV